MKNGGGQSVTTLAYSKTSGFSAVIATSCRVTVSGLSARPRKATAFLAFLPWMPAKKISENSGALRETGTAVLDS